MAFWHFFKKQSKARQSDEASAGCKKSFFFFGKKKNDVDLSMVLNEQLDVFFYSGADIATANPPDDPVDVTQRPTSGSAEMNTSLSKQLDLLQKENDDTASGSESQTLFPDEDVPDPEPIFPGQPDLLEKIENVVLLDEIESAASSSQRVEATEAADAIEDAKVSPSEEVSLWHQDLVEGTVLQAAIAKAQEAGLKTQVSHPKERKARIQKERKERIQKEREERTQTKETVVALSPIKSDRTQTVYWRASSETSEERGIGLTLDDYATSLMVLDRQQRKKLQQAVWLGINQNYLQRELVVIDSRATLLHDSYEEELQCFREVLRYLNSLLGDEENDSQLVQAIESLKKGNAHKAEVYLDEKSKQPSSFTAPAYYCGRLAERRVDLAKTLEMYKRALSGESDEPRYLLAAGITARTLYRYDEALPWLTYYVYLQESKRQEDPLLWARAQRELAYTYTLRGQYREAGPLYKQAMTTLAKHLGQSTPEMAASWYQIGEFQESLGEYEKAMILYKKTLYILEKHYGPFHPRLIDVLDRLGTLCMDLDMEKEAVYFYKRKTFIQKKTLRPDHPQLALSFDRLAEAYRLQGEYMKAEACYQRSLLINKTVYGADHPSVAVAYQELAKLSTRQNKMQKAEKYRQQAKAIFQKQFVAEEENGFSQETLLVDIQ